MNTNMNYPVKPARDNWQKICEWLYNVIKTNRLISFIILCVALGLFTFFMIKYSWVLWGYVIVSLLAIAVFGVKIQSLERQNKSLFTQINTLEGCVREKELELEQCKRDLSNIQNEFTIGKKYVNILMFIQDLDRNIDDLPESAKDFKDVVKKKLSKLLAMYGYKFLNYEAKYTDLYDCEYYPIESVDIIGRTIVNNNGEVILKGKIYLPENHDTKQ